MRLITLALRMQSVVELQGRQGAAATGHKAKGYYSGQPGRHTDNPSGRRLLETVMRQQLTLCGTKTRTGTECELATLPEMVQQILRFLGLRETLYTGLAQPLPSAGPTMRQMQAKAGIYAPD